MKVLLSDWKKGKSATFFSSPRLSLESVLWRELRYKIRNRAKIGFIHDVKHSMIALPGDPNQCFDEKAGTASLWAHTLAHNLLSVVCVARQTHNLSFCISAERKCTCKTFEILVDSKFVFGSWQQLDVFSI